MERPCISFDWKCAGPPTSFRQLQSFGAKFLREQKVALQSHEKLHLLPHISNAVDRHEERDQANDQSRQAQEVDMRAHIPSVSTGILPRARNCVGICIRCTMPHRAERRVMRVRNLLLFEYLLVSIFFTAVIVACSSPKSSDEDEASAVSCTEPENPYTDGTGHYVGYEWAESHGGSCDGRSSPFNEGCEEYEQQESEYQKCEEKKKK
jgi:hypothetical protein